MSQSTGQQRISRTPNARITELLKALGVSLPDPLYLLDNKGEIVAMNSAAETLNDALNIDHDLPQDIRPRVDEELSESGSEPDPMARPFIYPVDGVEKCYLPRVVKIEKWEGDQIGAAVLLSDVTEMRLREGIERDLVSAVSHEIRTPLTSIQMAIFMLLEQHVGKLNPTQSELLETARFECQRLLDTLNTLLRMVRSDEEEEAPKKNPSGENETQGSNLD